jgi:hypothetical protein
MSSGSEILNDSQRSTLELTSVLQAFMPAGCAVLPHCAQRVTARSVIHGFVPAEVSVPALPAIGGYSQSHQHLGQHLASLSHLPPFLSDALAYLSHSKACKHEGIFRCALSPIGPLASLGGGALRRFPCVELLWTGSVATN